MTAFPPQPTRAWVAILQCPDSLPRTNHVTRVSHGWAPSLHIVHSRSLGETQEACCADSRPSNERSFVVVSPRPLSTMAAIAPSLGLPGGLGPPPTPQPPPVSGRDYLLKLRKYLGANLTRLAPPPRGKTKDASWLAQSYTVLTLGLDPNSAPLSPSVKVPLTLGFGSPAQPPRHRPVLLRLPPDKLLYLLLRWQSLPQSLSHVGHTDVPVPDGVVPVARGRGDQPRREDGDVESVRSWVGSIRSVSMGTRTADGGGFGWWSKPKEVDEGGFRPA